MVQIKPSISGLKTGSSKYFEKFKENICGDYFALLTWPLFSLLPDLIVHVFKVTHTALYLLVHFYVLISSATQLFSVIVVLRYFVKSKGKHLRLSPF